MPYTNPPHFNDNIFQNQSKNQNRKTARAGDYAEVWQDNSKVTGEQTLEAGVAPQNA
jgi:hypothetical protein